MAWPAPHRVIWNEAAERWLTGDRRGPGWVRAFHRVSAPLAARTPPRLQVGLFRRQSASFPLFSPQTVSDDLPSRLLDVAPLYAGESVARIHDIRKAADVVIELSPTGY